MKKILLFTVLILSVAAGFVFANNNIYNGKGVNTMDKKVLIAYFSWSGNTEYIAELIHKEINSDMFRIETKEEYPRDYNETAYKVAKEQHEKNIHPELKDNGDVSNYDIIFIGTPAWWYTMSPAVMTFLENNNFKDKTIIPFITHGGGGKYNIADDMKKLAGNSNVLKPFVEYERGNSDTEKELQNWLKEIKIK